VLTRILDNGQEDKLGGVSKERDKEHHVGGHHQGDSIVSSITDRVHGMGRHFKNTVKGQGLLDQEEKVAPVYKMRSLKIVHKSVGLETYESPDAQLDT